MEKKWRQAKETEITAVLSAEAQPPGEPLRMAFETPSAEEIVLLLHFPADAGAKTGECLIKNGHGFVELTPAIPGTYSIMLTGIRGGGVSHVIRTGSKIHAWDGRDLALGELVVKW